MLCSYYVTCTHCVTYTHFSTCTYYVTYTYFSTCTHYERCTYYVTCTCTCYVTCTYYLCMTSSFTVRQVTWLWKMFWHPIHVYSRRCSAVPKRIKYQHSVYHSVMWHGQILMWESRTTYVSHEIHVCIYGRSLYIIVSCDMGKFWCGSHELHMCLTKYMYVYMAGACIS